MAAQVVKKLPEGDDWIYELKFDGYRALVIKDKQRVELRSRKNKDLAGMYPGIAAAGLQLKADHAVVDGEIVALDAQGKLALSRGGRPGSPTAAVSRAKVALPVLPIARRMATQAAGSADRGSAAALTSKYGAATNSASAPSRAPSGP